MISSNSNDDQMNNNELNNKSIFRTLKSMPIDFTNKFTEIENDSRIVIFINLD